MDKLLDIVAKWEPMGQGLFLTIALLVGCTLLYESLKLFVVLFRGWPPADPDSAD